MTQTVIDEIAAERRRQVEAECWSHEHDDQHSQGELAAAAACYASPVRAFKTRECVGRDYEPFIAYVDLWPWDGNWWKPGARRRDLVKAAALIVAEIERLDRMESPR